MSLINNVSGQLLQEGFETHSCTTSFCGGGNIDDVDCLSNWKPWFGTPSIKNTIFSPGGPNFLHLGYSSDGLVAPPNNISEGSIANLAQQGNIGDQLNLSFIGRGFPPFSNISSNVILRVFIASGVQGNWSLPDCFSPMPAINGLQIQEIATFPMTNFSTVQWGNVNVTNVCAEIPYDQLIFAIDFNGQPPSFTGAFLIDNVLLTRQSVLPLIEVISTIPNLCDEGNSISVTYEICADQDITVDINATANMSVTAQPASQTINIAAGTCEEVTIVYTEASDLADGSIIQFTLDLETSLQNSLCEVPSVESTFTHTYEKICFSEYPCLEEGSGFTLVPAGDFSTLIANGYLLPPAQAVNQSQKLLFEGDIFMDEFDYTFASGSELYFAPGVELEVEAGRTLRIFRSELKGCDKLWKGIKLNTRSYLRFINNKIHDALYAIEAVDLSQITLINNEFTDNYIGLYKADMGTLGTITQVDDPMNGNEFITSNLGLLPAYEGQPLSTGSIGRAGIVLNNCGSFLIGKPGTSFLSPERGNDFENLQNGIITFNSDVTVVAPFIKGIIGNFNATQTSFPGINGDFQQLAGFGIFSDGEESSSLKVEKGLIEDMVRGIHVQNTGICIVDVTETEFFSLQDGIIMTNLHGMFDINIRDNNPIQFRQYGVGYFNQNGTITDVLDIKDNTITQINGGNYPLMAGVRLSNESSLIRPQIMSNTIQAIEIGCNGIHLDRSRLCFVEENDIDHVGTQILITRGGPSGIFVEEGESNVIFANTIDYAITPGQAKRRSITLTESIAATAPTAIQSDCASEAIARAASGRMS